MCGSLFFPRCRAWRPTKSGLTGVRSTSASERAGPPKCSATSASACTKSNHRGGKNSSTGSSNCSEPNWAYRSTSLNGGEIAMSYRERGIEFDLSSSGRGLQQTLLLLAYMYANPGAVLLLDEPDAHLEVLRQRQTYQLLTDVADDTGSQIIAAQRFNVTTTACARLAPICVESLCLTASRRSRETSRQRPF